ncbi:nitrite/sulfite reductase [Sulfurimonas sp.]|uniref:nitrite/sulfite reductase n=1 Tax=Sulfurimonas sp. TaxID=2022749 RepID=UPI002AB16FB9|nr:nitrite/sulfite reductase [Sulfurimonas sp.]
MTKIMKKENPAQRVERIKKEKSGIDVLKDIHEYAIHNKEIDPEDIDRFKWYGLYTQNKNLQADDDETLYFMLRVKLVLGSINIEQMRVLADISKEFARETANITTRQAVQFHFIQVRDLPEIFFRLKSVGLSTLFAAGDVPRNITTCPVSSIDKSEIYDVSALALELNAYLDGNKELVNLPRKYKVGISGCSKHCMGHEIQDLSFTAVKSANGEVLFDVSVGGGLASAKQFALHLGYVKDKQILDVLKAVSIIYRDEGLRESRRKARLGHLINKWGIHKFKDEVQRSLGFNFISDLIGEYTPYSKREHFGIHESKQDGKSYIGCAVNGGFIGSLGLSSLADVLQKHGATTIRTTTTQNIVIVDAPSENAEDLAKELLDINIDANPNPFKARTLSCTGSKYCKFGVTETKDKAIELAEYLNSEFPDFNEKVSLSLNGCPNSCGHPDIVDIGLVGTKFKNKNGETITGFELVLGGNLEGNKSTLGKKMKLKIAPQDVNHTVANIIDAYIKSSKKYLGLFLKDLIEGDEFTVYSIVNR